MKVKILGTRGKIKPSAPKHRNYSGILIDDKILVDIGEETYLKYSPEAVVFTHFHPDHAFFVFDDQIFTPEIPLFGPESNELIPNLNVISGPFHIDDYRFTPIPVIHALHLRSYAYIIEKGNKRIMITGDMAWIEKAELRDLPNMNLIITEGSFIRKGGMIRRKEDKIFGHTGIPDLIRILGPLTNRIAFNHYGNWYFDDIQKANKTLKAFATPKLEIIPGYDGLEITI
ncbi:MBL fold metallo-hydrolase [Salinimicrobium gaetbulicola]|uniref:MBL fold metallo-hydrolase n=1 Tax=Salinimicrobium gaetbulicola TaxID=999702 RepID=A0ABW3IDK3_9FLAO